MAILIFNLNLVWSHSSDSPHHHKKSRDPQIKRPENGTGTILISYDNTTISKNDRRILIVFDLLCVNNITSTSTTNDKVTVKSRHIHSRYSECLDFYKNSTKHYDTSNYSYVWMDLKCDLSIIQAKKNITIDYDELCIEYIIYEPLFWMNQTTLIPDINTTAIPTHECNNITTDRDTMWNLDILDSPWLDGIFSYVDIESVVTADITDPSDPNGVDLFIIDSGIQDDHIEFDAAQIIHKMGDGPAKTVSKLGVTVMDDHGTHVAGSAGGRNYGSSKGLTIYDYRVCEFDDEGEVPCYTADIIEAMDDIYNVLKANPTRRGVINLSLGGQKSVAMNDLYHSYFQKLISYGGIPVVAAGNEDQDSCNVSPAYSSLAITVGAFGEERKKAWFSNWGNCVDIWGPGDPIWSAIPSNNANDRYGFLSGTSMASPLIAGIVANLLVVQPTLNFHTIKDTILRNNSVRVTSDECDQYECLSPVYACGRRVYGDPIPWSPDQGLGTVQIILIVIGAILFVLIVVVIILYITKDKRNKKVKHTKIPDKENPNMVENTEEEQAIIAAINEAAIDENAGETVTTFAI